MRFAGGGAPRKYAQENDLKWVQGFLGEPSQTDLSDRYGVMGIPTIFLIGPDGKVIARHPHGGAIKAAVAKALAVESYGC